MPPKPHPSLPPRKARPQLTARGVLVTDSIAETTADHLESGPQGPPAQGPLNPSFIDVDISTTIEMFGHNDGASMALPPHRVPVMPAAPVGATPTPPLPVPIGTPPPPPPEPASCPPPTPQAPPSNPTID